MIGTKPMDWFIQLSVKRWFGFSTWTCQRADRGHHWASAQTKCTPLKFCLLNPTLWIFFFIPSAPLFYLWNVTLRNFYAKVVMERLSVKLGSNGDLVLVKLSILTCYSMRSRKKAFPLFGFHRCLRT